MRYEQCKKHPTLPQTIDQLILTDEIKKIGNDQFVFLEGSIIMMAKKPTLDKLSGNICSY